MAYILAWVLALGLSIYDMFAWGYVMSVVWRWTIAPTVGFTLSELFFAGVVFFLRYLKWGLATTLDQKKEPKEVLAYMALALAYPWLLLLIVWAVIS